MGGSLCRVFCCRQAEDGDALDLLSAEDLQQRRVSCCGQGKKTWAERQVEEYFKVKASCSDNLNVRFMMWMCMGGFPLTNPSERVIHFIAEPSPIVKGLQLLQPAAASNAGEVLSALSGGKRVIVGSVRMGYGHHRIAYSALTWALSQGLQPYLMDILAPDCIEADIVKSMDKNYSRMSRLASKFGGAVDAIWGRMTLKADMNMLRFMLVLGQKIRPIFAGLPRDVPIISTHPIVGNMAIACGFKKVINLVFDNYPQYFVIVPGALNLVQTPSYFDKLLDMGCPAAGLRFAGHWVSHDLCANAIADCEARLQRCGKPELPRRFLVAVGGAGAQRSFLEELLQGLAENLRKRRLRLFVNCGDHTHIADAIVKCLKKLGLEWDEVTTSEDTEEFCRNQPLQAVSEPPVWKAVTLFRFTSHFAAFRCTDLVIRIADVLVTKPSELAFFPVPKLHIRRVGAHEAFSAVRAGELGDGTVECRTVPHALQKVAQLSEERSPLFKLMNQCVITAAKTGVYEGSRVACECALAP
uniref:Monogalactosyldiacylglycerol synthase n=1 Tax=Alexandrium catenella TaxID=2925 RepID=A0A7S1RK75_ALECA|mmetsp:Transcript_62263/g.166473  ORF Transcript_62263/g.166473 Transcript_62263/m.166473 type:complete len:526 (+) Transcript_62263:67-1644(+)